MTTLPPPRPLHTHRTLNGWPPPKGPPATAQSSAGPDHDDWLIASGVLSVVAASVTGTVGGLFLMWAASLTAGSPAARESTAPWTPTWGTALVLHLGLFTAVLVSGIGALRGRAWARSITLVVQTLLIGVLVFCAVEVPWFGWSVPLGWSVATWVFAAIGTPTHRVGPLRGLGRPAPHRRR